MTAVLFSGLAAVEKGKQLQFPCCCFPFFVVVRLAAHVS